MSKISLAETPFSSHLNNHRSDVSDSNVIPACRHFSQSNHDFNTHAKIHPNLKEKIKRKQANRSYSGYSKKTQKLLDYWSDTLNPHGLNQELNP